MRPPHRIKQQPNTLPEEGEFLLPLFRKEKKDELQKKRRPVAFRLNDLCSFHHHRYRSGRYGNRRIHKFSQNDVVRSDLVEISSAVSQYNYDIGEYPTNLTALTSKKNGKGPWLDELKKDPWNQDYQYKISSDKKRYAVWSKMKDGKGATPDVNTPANNTKASATGKSIYVIGH